MRNIRELRTELVAIYDGLKTGKLELKLGAEMNNTLGKVLSSLKVELAKCALTGETPRIDFLEGEPQAALPTFARKRVTTKEEARAS